VGSPDYCRVRVGVGRPPPRVDPADYVLGRFSKGEEKELEACVAWAVEAVRTVVEQGATKAMNLFNRRDAAGRAPK
jgi:PTH1 family peptidyl-tRNA hydrolase